MTGTLLLPSELQLELWRAARAPHPAHIQSMGALKGLRDAMRRAIPIPGSEFNAWMTLLLGPGERQGDHVVEHTHREWTVLYYPEACPPIVVRGEPHHPRAGEILVLAPNTPHAVPTVTAPRLSVAMLVSGV